MPCTVDCRSLYLVSLCQPVPDWPAALVEYPPHSWRGTSQFYRLQHIRSTLTIEQSQAKPTYSICLNQENTILKTKNGSLKKCLNHDKKNCCVPVPVKFTTQLFAQGKTLENAETPNLRSASKLARSTKQRESTRTCKYSMDSC
jgi:hypothetical protein